MTDNISELIAGIRAWQAAEAEYDAAHGKWVVIADNNNEDAREAYVDVSNARGKLLRCIPDFIEFDMFDDDGLGSELLPVFVALADHVAALEARIARAEAAHEPVKQISRLLSREYGDIYEGELAEPLEETLRLLDKWSDLLNGRSNNALLGEPTASAGDA